MVLPPDESVAGRVNDRVTGVLAWPETSNRPPFVRSVALTVLFTPGKTFPKLSCWAPTTLIGVCTLAVAVMLALFVWAWSVVPVRTRAATTRDSFVMLRIRTPRRCGVELLISWSAIRRLHASETKLWQGLCQPTISCSLSKSLTNRVVIAEVKIGLGVSERKRNRVSELLTVSGAGMSRPQSVKLVQYKALRRYNCPARRLP